MYENNFPQIANENELKERPEGDKSTKQSIRCQGGPSESSGQQAAEAREQKPGEKNQRDGDFITVKLGEELPNGDQLNSNGGDAGPDNRPYDKRLTLQFRAPILLQRPGLDR